MPARPLTAKQRAFAQHYAACGIGAEAAREAGYSPRSAAKIASDLLKDDRIQEAIASAGERISEAVEDAAGVEAADVLRGLYAEATRTGKGSTHAARVSAWRSIGEILGMFRRPEAPRGIASVAAVRVEIVLPEHAGARPVLTEHAEAVEALPDGSRRVLVSGTPQRGDA